MSDTSIRTPVWGVTNADASVNVPGVFQFAPRVGGDWYKDFFGIRYSISIRTPAWGATRAVPRTAV